MYDDEGYRYARRSNDGRDTLGKRWGMMGDMLIGPTLYKRRSSASLCPTFCSVFIPCLYSHFILDFAFVLKDTTFPYINSISLDVRVRYSYRCPCIIYSPISHVRNLRIVPANLFKVQHCYVEISTA